MMQSAKNARRALRMTALTAALALCLTGCEWEDFFGPSASDSTGGGKPLVQQ